MNKQEAIKAICQAIGEATNNNFPCICGENPLGTNLNYGDEAKLQVILKSIRETNF